MYFRYHWDAVYVTFIFSWTVLIIKIFIKRWYFSMKFCLLITVALDIFIKGKNNTSYLPWISPLSFFYAKSIYSAKLTGKPYFWLGGLLNYSYGNICFILKCCKSTVLKFSYWPFVCRFRTLGTLGQFLLRISP